jgi:hypothetical protein
MVIPHLFFDSLKVDRVQMRCRATAEGGREMVMEVVGLVIVVSHVMAMGFLILWFGLGKPTSAEQFWTRFKREFFGVGRHTK